jgi:hypothetical protein
LRGSIQPSSFRFLIDLVGDFDIRRSDVGARARREGAQQQCGTFRGFEPVGPANLKL